jgi:hypothetical protein
MSVKVRKFRRGGYEVDIIVRLPDGTRLRERKKTPCTSKSAAQRWGEERQAILVLNGKPRRKEVPTLDAFAARYMDEHVKANRHKPSTQSLKEHIIGFYLKPRWAKRRLDDIHDADVQKLKAELAHLSPKTVNNVLCVLNTMLKVGVEWNVLEAMPACVKLLKVSPSEVPFYEPHEYERLVEAPTSIGDHRLLVFVLLGGDAGLRCGEIIAVEQTASTSSAASCTSGRANGKATSPRRRAAGGGRWSSPSGSRRRWRRTGTSGARACSGETRAKAR